MSALCALVAIALPIAAREEPPIPMARPMGAADRTRLNASYGPRTGRRLGTATDDHGGAGAAGWSEWESYALQFAYNRESAARFGPRLINMQAYWQAMWNQGTDEALDCSRVVRVGDVADLRLASLQVGGKLLCDDAMPKPGEPCRVVSL